MTFDSKLPKGDLPGWKQVFTEGFNTPVAQGDWSNSTYYTSKFRTYGPSDLAKTNPSWTDSSKHGVYMPEILSVANGHLTEHIHTDIASSRPFVAAISPIRSDTGASFFNYGRFSVRARFDQLANYKVAWLLWPEGGNNNRDGEIDFPELNLWDTVGRGFCHYTDQVPGTPTDQGYYKVPFNFWTVMHVWTMEWSPQKVVFILDGEVVKTFTGDRIPHVPMRWILQTETGIGVPKPAPNVAGNIDIGWIAAWVYQP